MICFYPNVAKAGGLQSQGVEGEAVVVYREPLTTTPVAWQARI